MTTVLLLQAPDAGAPPLAADLAAVGFSVLGPEPCAALVREALKASPDVVVAWDPRPGQALLDDLRTLQAQQPVPVVVFTQDAGVETMRQALEAGAHAWVVQGYGRERLRPLVHLAQAREEIGRKQRAALAELGERLEERKLVDKAKGILMKARHVSEEEAFQLLRTASMHGNQRVGVVSRQVIDTAQVGEAVNRAGQQRMLSQRIVKLYALACSKTDAAAATLLMRQSMERIDENLAALSKLSSATFGDLVEATQAAWTPLRNLVVAPPEAKHLVRMDELADAMVVQAESFVTALENAGLARTVGVVNVAGRQRMLSQRMAKLALLSALLPAQAEAARAAMAETAAAFEAALATLEASPLSSREIREAMEAVRVAWGTLRLGADRAGDKAGRMQIAAASEELFGLLDRLTDAYQHSLQVLMG